MHPIPRTLWSIMKLWKVIILAKSNRDESIICSLTVIVPLKPLCIFLTEEIIRGLQQLGWKKVDVSFHSSFWPFFAHNNIHVLHPLNFAVRDDCIIDTEFLIFLIIWFQVKNEWLHNAGVGVIAHVADSLRQQEASSILVASL